jgi:hypothetical protein
MQQPSTPSPVPLAPVHDAARGPTPRGSALRLLALIETWRAAPDDGQDHDAIVAQLDRARREHPIRFHDLDLSDWSKDDE